ncbi:MAG TPA: hypothetical protein DCL21_03405 [Alphaproteobacteria bacterium]|nr:hypothetical protein [Alphaproteobacteria bacterium]
MKEKIQSALLLAVIYLVSMFFLVVASSAWYHELYLEFFCVITVFVLMLGLGIILPYYMIGDFLQGGVRVFFTGAVAGGSLLLTAIFLQYFTSTNLQNAVVSWFIVVFLMLVINAFKLDFSLPKRNQSNQTRRKKVPLVYIPKHSRNRRKETPVVYILMRGVVAAIVGATGALAVLQAELSPVFMGGVTSIIMLAIGLILFMFLYVILSISGWALYDAILLFMAMFVSVVSWLFMSYEEVKALHKVTDVQIHINLIVVAIIIVVVACYLYRMIKPSKKYR